MAKTPVWRPLMAFAITSARGLFEKLERDAAAVQQEVSSDALFDFVVTSWSLVDWIKYDPASPAAAKTARDALRNEPLMKVCRDLAFGCKHHTLDRGDPITAAATSWQGYGLGRFGAGAFGMGEESVQIMLTDVATYDALEFVDGVMKLWRDFIAAYGI